MGSIEEERRTFTQSNKVVYFNALQMSLNINIELLRLALLEKPHPLIIPQAKKVVLCPVKLRCNDSIPAN